MFRQVRLWVSVSLLITALVLTAGCSSRSNPNLELGGINLAEVLDGLMARTQQALASVKDQHSAQAASKQLELISQDFDDLAYHAPKLPVNGQVALTKEVSKNLFLMQDMAESVHNSPILRDILGEQMDSLVVKMKGLMAL